MFLSVLFRFVDGTRHHHFLCNESPGSLDLDVTAILRIGMPDLP
jgi:hypothetical protein